MKNEEKMESDLIKREIHLWSLNAFSRTGSGSVKGDCEKGLCAVKGIYLPLTGSDQALSWRLRLLMGQLKTLLLTSLNFAKIIMDETNDKSRFIDSSRW